MSEGRSRRANAGNKLQKLIEQERLLNEATSSGMLRIDEDEDDVVNLLFQTGGGGGGEGAGGSGEGLTDEEEDNEFVAEIKENEDDFFTDDDDEDAYSSDEEAGERALQREERKNKKRKLKQQVRHAAGSGATVVPGSKHAVPIIRKRKTPADLATSSSNRKKLAEELLNPETLLSEDRRTSSRKSVVANKLKVYSNLQKAEKLRKEIKQKLEKSNKTKHVHVMTQEERLQEALETEKINLQSLNKFKELEDFNKQKRLMMQQRNKVKFQNEELVLSQFSCDWRVTPIMEINDYLYWKEQLHKRENKNKRRKTTKKPVDASAEQEQPPLTVDDLIKYNFDTHDGSLTLPESSVPAGSVDAPKVNLEEQDTKPDQDAITNIEIDSKLNIDGVAEVSTAPDKQTTAGSNIEKPDVEGDVKETVEKILEGNVAEEETTKDIAVEGPEQRISKNFVTIFKYNNFEDKAVNAAFVTETLLGIIPSPSRTKNTSAALAQASKENMETILLSKTDPDKQNPFNTTSINNEKLYTQIMGNFPKFGEFTRKFQSQEINEINVIEKVKLKTQPPTGLYLPNGQKKPCLIKGTPSQYFDPKFGIPYSDLESYKLLQDMVQNPDLFKWHGFKNGGILLNPNIKPAAGVPEGF